MRTDFEGPRGFAAASAEADAELAAIAAYREAADARSKEPDVFQRIGLWNADPDGALSTAAEAFGKGDLQSTVESSSLAKAVWQAADDVGRSRALAVSASLAAILLGSWLTYRWYRDRGVRRRTFLQAHRRLP
jgi:hypothetical protein